VWFDGGAPLAAGKGVQLDRRTRMLYDERHVFINGESFRAAGRDATLIRRLADERTLAAPSLARLSEGARELLDQWAQAGWLHALDS
jgi:50S ribosomal protein L16 3-hydroxylase